jgi:hypothetical protein
MVTKHYHIFPAFFEFGIAETQRKDILGRDYYGKISTRRT